MSLMLAVPRHNINLNTHEVGFLVRSLVSAPGIGNTVSRFEEAFAAYIGAGHGIGFSSGSAALYHAVQASGLTEGDSIIVPEYEFYSVVETLRLCGLKVRFAKVRPEDGNVDLPSIQAAMSEEVKAVLVAHIHGNPAPIPEIADWCRQQNLLLVEDCAHSAGASLDGRQTGSFGDFAVFSFGDGKALTACGGGMVTTSNDEFARKLRETRDSLVPPPRKVTFRKALASLAKWALSTRIGFTLTLFPIAYLYAEIFRGNLLDRLFRQQAFALRDVPADYRFRLTDLEGALGLSQLSRLKQLNRIRCENAAAIAQQLAKTEGIVLPQNTVDGTCLNFRLQVKDAAALSTALIEQGIDTRRDYLMIYSDDHPYGLRPKQSVYIADHPGLRLGEADRVGRAVAECVEEK